MSEGDDECDTATLRHMDSPFTKGTKVAAKIPMVSVIPRENIEFNVGTSDGTRADLHLLRNTPNKSKVESPIKDE